MSTSTKNGLFYPKEYFKNNERLVIWNTFPKRILSKLDETVACRGASQVSSIELERSMEGDEIIKEFFGGMEGVLKVAHTFDQFDQIAAKIDLWSIKERDISRGASGMMGAQIFPVVLDGEFFFICVSERMMGPRWAISEWGLKDLFGCGWPAGSTIYK